MLPNFSLIKANDCPYQLQDYNNHVILVVNIATQCTLKKQLRELETLYQTYRSHNFSVIAFPTNEFNQEPLFNSQIIPHCSELYGVSYTINQQVFVNGPNAHPIYQWLKLEQPGFMSPSIKWNYTKFLIDRSGTVVKRYSPLKCPIDIAKHIEYLL